MAALSTQAPGAAVGKLLATLEPVAALGDQRLALAVWPSPLARGGRVIYGAWDPLLRRIELFGVALRSDAELVTTFVHELLHAIGDRSTRELDEESLHRRAVGLVSKMEPQAIEGLAAKLRACCDARTHDFSEKAEGAVPPSLPGRGQGEGEDLSQWCATGWGALDPPVVPPERGDGWLRAAGSRLCPGDCGLRPGGCRLRPRDDRVRSLGGRTS